MTHFDINYTILGTVSIGVTLVVYLINRMMAKARYDQNEKRIILEDMRRSFESQMYHINDRLLQNEERWQDVNHLLLKQNYAATDQITEGSQRVQLSNFLKSNGITENDLLIDSKLIFVLTPFHDRFTMEYRIIEAACSRAGFKCLRGDETYFKGDIFPEMLKYIVRSRLIIANIDGRNPNVLYELGIAQALDKAVLLIAKQPEDIPIDIRTRRFLIYKTLNELSETLLLELRKITVL